MNLDQLLQLLSGGGAFGIAIFMLWLFLTERVVPKGRLDDQKALTKDALDIARSSVAANERLANAFEAKNEAEARVR